MKSNSKKIKVKDNPTLVRDQHSKAILNVDQNDYVLSRMRRKNLVKKDMIISDMKSEIEMLRNKYDELVDMIKSIQKS